MPPDSDCLIVGAGLVGSIAALVLAQMGFRVAVIEQRQPRRADSQSDVRALVLSAASVRVLEHCGVWPRIEAIATPVREIHVSDRGGFPTARLSAREIGQEALGWACPGDRLLGAFNAAILDCGQVSVHWSSRFVCARAGAERIDVDVEGNNLRTTFATRLLIGADGTDSTVRAASQIPVECLPYGQAAIVANVTASRPREATAFEHFTRRGPLALIPTGAARYVCVQCLDQTAAADALTLRDDAYLAMLERRFGNRLGHFSQIGPRRMHDLERRNAKRLSAARTLIVGNAANTVHPNAAQGLNLGLRDVAAFAQAFDKLADPGDSSALERYCRLRKRDHALTGAFTDVLAQAFRSRLASVTCARRTALALTAYLPPVRRRLLLDASGLAAIARPAFGG